MKVFSEGLLGHWFAILDLLALVGHSIFAGLLLRVLKSTLADTLLGVDDDLAIAFGAAVLMLLVFFVMLFAFFVASFVSGNLAILVIGFEVLIG